MTMKTRNRVLEKIFPVNSLDKYVIPNWQSNVERELNMQAKVKPKNGKKKGYRPNQ